MDGGGRLLQPLGTIFSRLRPAKAAVAAVRTDAAGKSAAGKSAAGKSLSAERLSNKSVPAKSGPAKSAVRDYTLREYAKARSAPLNRWQRTCLSLTRRGAGLAMVACLLLGTGAYGSFRGGAFDRFIAENGSVKDLAARAFGFGIDAITISGQRVLLSTEVLAIAKIRQQDSLLFLNVKDIRENLIASPMIQTANVRKLYPNQLIITIGERTADAVWQRDGEVSIIAADGRVIDKMRDQRYARLPFIVGDGANKRFAEYMTILSAAGPLRSKIRAGTLIGKRRWTLKFSDGLELKLPEDAPEQAMAQFAALVKTHDLLDKDLIVADMRVPGRFIGQLSAEAMTRREEQKTKKPAKKGGAA